MIASNRAVRSLWKASKQQRNHTRRRFLGSSSYSGSAHAVSWSSGHHLLHDDDEETLQRTRRTQLQGLPFVVAMPTTSFLVSRTLVQSSSIPQQQSYLYGQHRWLSSSANPDESNQTASTTTTTAKEDETRNDNKNNDVDDDDEKTRQEAATLRERATAYQVRARERAGQMRESAVEHYHEFREHPRESARKGAQTFGGMIKRYGPIFVGTYFVVYVSTLGLLFVGVEGGVLDPVSLFSWLGSAGGGEGEEVKNTVHLVVEFMNSHSYLEPYSHYIEKNPSVANLAVAWIAVKFTEPIRLAITLGITPRVARSVGWTVPTEAEENENVENKTSTDEVDDDSATLYKDDTKKKNNADSAAEKS